MFIFPGKGYTELVGHWSFDDINICQPAINQVQNHSFEENYTNWQGTCPVGLDCSIDHTESIDGQNSLKVVFNEGDNFFHISQNISLKPDTYYKISYYLKTQDRSDRTSLEYLLYKADGSPIDCEGSQWCHAKNIVGHNSGTHGWQRFKTYFKSSSDTAAIEVRLRRFDEMESAGTAWWDAVEVMEIAGLKVPDESGHQNEGMIKGGVECVPGRIGHAVKFDGKNDLIEIPHSDSLNITDKLTIDAWVKGEAYQRNMTSYMINKTDSYRLQVSAYSEEVFKPRFQFHIRKSDNSGWYEKDTLKDILDSEWHHVVTTFDSSMIQTFVDDEFTGEMKLATKGEIGSFLNDTIFPSENPLVIGGIIPGTGNLIGAIDEVKIIHGVTQYYGFNTYRLNLNDKVIIDDYSNDRRKHFISKLQTIEADNVTLSVEIGDQIHELQLIVGEEYREQDTNIEIVLESVVGDEATIRFEPIISPSPKIIKHTDKEFSVDHGTKIVLGSSPWNRKIAQQLQNVIQDRLGIIVEIANQGEIVEQESNLILIGSRADNYLLKLAVTALEGSPGVYGDEGYNIYSHADYLILEAENKVTAAYAKDTVLQLLDNDGNFMGVQIMDFPTIDGMRAFHITHLNQRLVTVDYVKELINRLAELKYNTLFIKVTNWSGFIVQLDSHPEVCNEYAITKEQMQELIGYANSLNIEVIPEVNTITKANQLFGGAYPELMLNDWTFDPTNPQTYQLLSELLDEVIEIFQPRYLHIGNDELYGYVGIDIGTSDPIMTPKHFEEGIILVSNYLQDKGIRPIMWGDMLLNKDFFPEKDACFGKENNIYQIIDDLPKNIIIADWHYRYRGSTSFPTVDYFQNKGFDVIGATWSDMDTAFYFSQYLHERERSPVGMMATTWYVFSPDHQLTVDTIIDSSAEAFWSGKTNVDLDFPEELETTSILDILIPVISTFSDKFAGEIKNR